jgi:hypothetical protein
MFPRRLALTALGGQSNNGKPRSPAPSTRGGRGVKCSMIASNSGISSREGLIQTDAAAYQPRPSRPARHGDCGGRAAKMILCDSFRNSFGFVFDCVARVAELNRIESFSANSARQGGIKSLWNVGSWNRMGLIQRFFMPRAFQNFLPGTRVFDGVGLRRCVQNTSDFAASSCPPTVYGSIYFFRSVGCQDAPR